MSCLRDNSHNYVNSLTIIVNFMFMCYMMILHLWLVEFIELLWVVLCCWCATFDPQELCYSTWLKPGSILWYFYDCTIHDTFYYCKMSLLKLYNLLENFVTNNFVLYIWISTNSHTDVAVKDNMSTIMWHDSDILTSLFVNINLFDKKAQGIRHVYIMI